MTLADKVKEIVNSDSLVMDSIIEKSIQRLESFGVELTESDTFELSFAVGKVQENIQNECNIVHIPNELTYTAVDMVAGQFLDTRQSTGRLTEFDVKRAIKSVKTGDTTTTFQENKQIGIEGFIQYLMNPKRGDLLSYRKLKW